MDQATMHLSGAYGITGLFLVGYAWFMLRRERREEVRLERLRRPPGEKP